MEDRKFSVLMAVYIKENPVFLTRALESLLFQTVVPTEIVIIRDGKLTDELNEVLQNFSNNDIVKIYGYEENKGLGYALSYGVNCCKYDIIARMDSDDICDKTRFEKELNILKHENVDIVGSNTIEFEDNIENVISHRCMPELHDEILKYSKTRNPFIHPSIMTYKKVILDAGNYRSYYLVEDYDLWTRILNLGYKSYNIQENLVFMRVGKDFYRRRGGIKYCRSIVSFKKELFKKGYMSRNAFLKTKYATIFVSLMPGFLREFIYKKYLRK